MAFVLSRVRWPRADLHVKNTSDIKTKKEEKKNKKTIRLSAQLLVWLVRLRLVPTSTLKTLPTKKRNKKKEKQKRRIAENNEELISEFE